MATTIPTDTIQSSLCHREAKDLWLPPSRQTLSRETYVTARLKIYGYHHPDRNDGCGKRGRLLAYISAAFNYDRRRHLECDDIQLLWIVIIPPRCVCFVYRPPKIISRLDRYIASNIENVTLDIYVLGDFNLDLIKGSH